METEKVSHLTDCKDGLYHIVYMEMHGGPFFALFFPRIMQLNIARLCIPNNVFNDLSFSVLHAKYCSIIKTKGPSYPIWNAYFVAILSHYLKKTLHRSKHRKLPRSQKRNKRYFYVISFNNAFFVS